MGVWGNDFSFGTPNSQVIRSGQQVRDDYATQEKNYQSEMARISAAIAAIQSKEDYANTQTQQYVNSGALDSFFADQAAINPIWSDPGKQAQYKQDYVASVAPTLAWGGNADAASQKYVAASPQLSSVSSYSPDALRSGYEAEGKAAGDAFTKQKSEYDAYMEGEKRQTSAYQDMSGGGYQGGFINEAYANPFGGTPGADTSTTFGSLAANMGGASGLGQSTPNGIGAAGQETGFGTFQGVGAQPKQLNAGWGGPFDQWKGWS